jgi:hypothetical protein
MNAGAGLQGGGVRFLARLPENTKTLPAGATVLYVAGFSEANSGGESKGRGDQEMHGGTQGKGKNLERSVAKVKHRAGVKERQREREGTRRREERGTRDARDMHVKRTREAK